MTGSAMMFAKFSGRPIRTVISSVTTPASSKGTNVSRHVGHSSQHNEEKQADRKQRPKPGLAECPDNRIAGLLNGDGLAHRVGVDRAHRLGKPEEVVVIVRIARGRDLDAGAAVGAHPVARQIGRNGSNGHLPGGKRSPQQIEHRIEARHQGVARRVAFLRRRLGHFVEEAGQAASVVGALAGHSGGRRGEGGGGVLHGLHVFRVGRRLLLAGGIEQGRQGLGKRRDDRELFVLLFGNETLKARHPGGLRQLLQTRHKRWRLGEGRSENVYRVGSGVRILHQIQHGCNGFDFGAAQIQRIEIEMKVAQQRSSGQGHQQCPDDDRITVIGHELIDGEPKIDSRSAPVPAAGARE